MPTVGMIASFLEHFAPADLAEDWDNVGLLVGDPSADVRRIMTCLTVTPSSMAEAVREQAQLVITHHPLPFRPLKRITTESTSGRLLLEAMRHRIAVHSSHTAFDSAADGINRQLAVALELRNIEPLAVSPTRTGAGTGRKGRADEGATVATIASRLKSFLRIEHVQLVGSAETAVHVVAIGCGSAGSLLELAQRQKCDLFITGESSFHTCLEAEASQISMVLTGHYASERFAVEYLAEVLARQFSDVTAWASRDERDPVRFH